MSARRVVLVFALTIEKDCDGTCSSLSDHRTGCAEQGVCDQWYADNVESQAWVPYPGDAGLEHFVIDSSRNGVGLGAIRQRAAPASGRAGIKVPGESDGECNRWEPAGSPDPVRMREGPAAGDWFPEMALELAKNANPRL